MTSSRVAAVGREDHALVVARLVRILRILAHPEHLRQHSDCW
jgi:hypothetical protein